MGGGFRANNFGNDCNSNTNPNTHSNIGRHLGISLLCISFSHLPLLDPTNMAADGYNFCGQQVAITQSIISIEISYRLQILTMLLALLFGPEKYCGGGSQGGYLIDNY